jgi:hypothetical protein
VGSNRSITARDRADLILSDTSPVDRERPFRRDQGYKNYIRYVGFGLHLSVRLARGRPALGTNVSVRRRTSRVAFPPDRGRPPAGVMLETENRQRSSERYGGARNRLEGAQFPGNAPLRDDCLSLLGNEQTLRIARQTTADASIGNEHNTSQVARSRGADTQLENLILVSIPPSAADVPALACTCRRSLPRQIDPTRRISAGALPRPGRAALETNNPIEAPDGDNRRSHEIDTRHYTRSGT